MKPVSNWQSAWRWFSVQAMFIAGSLQGAWMAIPSDLQARVPGEWVDVMTVAILVMGILGRLVDQGGGEDDTE